MLRKLCKVSTANQRQLRRRLAWLTLVNYLVSLSYAVIVQIGSHWMFAMGVFLLGYNYLLVRLVVAIPKRTFTMKSHSYLIIPLVASVCASCLVVILTFWP